MQYPINDEGVTLLKEFEDFVGIAYKDIAGIWTIGWGFTKGVKPGDKMTKPEGDARLAAELKDYTDVVLASCTITPNENQLAAMVVLAWNIGLGWSGPKKPKGAKDGFRQSSVLKAHNRSDFGSAARAFGLWNKSTIDGVQVEVAGLTRRRAAESSLYLKPVQGQPAQAMPQAVAPESKVGTSPTVLAGGGAAVASALGAATQVTQQVNSLKDALGGALPYVAIALAVVAVLATGYVIYVRLKQRKTGWV